MSTLAPPTVRQELRRTWFPFFSRFGRLTRIQELAMPRILAGENLVLISPAASGKTEAVAAPLVERVLREERRTGPAILYVSPTRALVNDLYRRLEEAVTALGLEIGRKTGDHPRTAGRTLPFLLITTPESLDSLLCRRPRDLVNLGAVVLDELHLLDNSPRGDQLRVLLERLRLIKPGVQYCALSATVDDEGIGGRYFPEAGVVKVADERAIDDRLFPLDGDWAGRVVAELAARGCRKALVFFNARSWAESAVSQLDRPPFQGRVRVHHGSLDRREREEVEAAMNGGSSGLLCCTSTLELGIDIGDVDAVVLVRPPFGVSSLLQRIGRGNRRNHGRLVALGFHADSWERFLFKTLFDCARTGRLHEKPYTPSLSVIPQQVVSYLYQRRRIGATAVAVQRALAPLGNPAAVEQVFRHLVEQGVVVATRPGIYALGDRLERQVRYGRIHSNIQQKSFGKFEVREASTGRQLGTVFFVFRQFLLAGRTWELVEFREKEGLILVRPSAAVGAAAKVFEGTGTGGHGYRLAQVLKSRLFPELAPDEFPWFADGGQVFFVHLLGSTHGYLIAEALGDASDLDGRVLAFPYRRGPGRSAGAGRACFPVPEAGSLRRVVRDNLARLEDSLGSGAFFPFLPEELKIEDHLLALDMAGTCEFLRRVRLVEMSAGAVAGRVAARMAQEV
ncbi:MAG TPA: DEAD/DEAH box helicase [candidate division WOR-3 bacterium]|uniref:DEAD/DEAH box helicase n=1 Tax=candidate division WOR-3 bacterium TaxID=2052148 RepID=A0A7V0T7R8_UNCW3|nr:DEAD/DEAH box helicase [candidate division WOR-3 bacterium]